MADTPTPRSYPQIVGDMVDTFLAKQKLSGIRPGNPILSFIEAAASSDLRSSQDVFGLLNSVSLDNSNGLALIRIGEDENVNKRIESPSSGKVDIGDTSFTKLSSKLFQGKPAPIVGTFTIYVQNASLWPATGQVYLGRGTSNYEGPLSYSAVTNLTTHWSVTLSQATTKIHNVGESVVVAQGGIRTIGKGAVVKTPQANVADAIEFRTLYNASIPDGETSVSGVVVVAEKPGVIGNVPAGIIKNFSQAPFTGATVTNPLPFSNGRETERDDELRERIRVARKTRAKGTPLAIRAAVDGITASDESKRVTSTSLVTRTGYPTALYIDDGTGYEEQSSGVSVEILVDSALGGEEYFQSRRRPIAKAFLLSRNAAPFLLKEDAELIVRVGGSTYTHRFDGESFASIGSASAYEVVASINANESLGFTARTAAGGATVAISGKEDDNEDIEVVGGLTDAFRFPAGTAYSLQLYLNDRLLGKDGREASFPSEVVGNWDLITGVQTLSVAVDDGPTVTYTFTDADFVNAKTGFTTVANHTAAAWVKVLNRKIPGMTAREDGGRILLTSSAGKLNSGMITVAGGSLVTARMFATGSATGKSRDYTADRNTAQIRLESPLAAGDRLSIGSSATRSFIESGAIPATTTVSAGELFLSVDGDSTSVPLAISADTQLTISVNSLHDWGSRLKIAATAGLPFFNVKEGDWLVLSDVTLPVALAPGMYRIAEVDRDAIGVLGSYVIIERPSAKTARSGHQTVALAAIGGAIAKVLAIGGHTRAVPTSILSDVPGVTDGCELFDPNTGASTLAGNLTLPRAFHTATLLNDGRVLVAGGVTSNGVYLTSTELYDPSTDTWTGGPVLPEAVAHHQAVKLASGDVVFIGGYRIVDGIGVFSTQISRFNSGAGTMTTLGVTLTGARARHRCVLLLDGRILIAGGQNDTDTLATCELLTPGVPSIAAAGAMNARRTNFGLEIRLGVPVAIGNDIEQRNGTSFETYDTGSNTWTGGQISSTKIVHFDAKQLVKDNDGAIYAMHAWYWLSGARVSVVYKYTGTWAELATHSLTKDSHTWYGKQWTCVATTDLSTKNQLIGLGGTNARSGSVVAQHEWYNGTSSIWNDLYADTFAAVTQTLSSPPGITCIRSEQVLQWLTLNAGSNYTASTLSAFLNSLLVGASASTYKTNRIRLATNSFGLEGDVAVAAGNPAALSTFKVAAADAVDNLVGHMASVESGTPEAGTPSFQECQITGQLKPIDVDSASGFVLSLPSIGGGDQLVGLRSFWTGRPESFHIRYGSGLNAHLRLAYLINGDIEDGCKVDVRERVPSRTPISFDRFFAAAPFAIGPEDSLTVQADSDLNKRFSIGMWRKLKPTTNTYGFSNAYKDADNANATIATQFGLTFPFNDYTVYMKARALAYTADATKRVLFRYYRPGPDGEFARVRFSNPEAALAPLKVAVENGDIKSSVRVHLTGGAARTLSVRSTTRLGSSCPSALTDGFGTVVFYVGASISNATRTVANTTMALTATLPAGTATFGLNVGDVIYLQSSNANFASGSYTVSAVAAPAAGAQVVTVTDPAGTFIGSGANIGTVSFDSQGQVLFSGSGIVPGDFLRINKLSSVLATYEENTFYISSLTDQSITCTSGEGSVVLNTAGRIDALNDASYLSIFASVPQTVTQIATSVNALAAVENSACPITMTVTGSGGGNIVRSTSDDLTNHSWYDLADGVNWIAETSYPANIALDYNFTFKRPIFPSLTVNCDWLNEDIRVVPTTASNVVRWLNTPAVSGLSASCLVQASSGGSRIQLASKLPGSKGAVHVQGGLANSVNASIKGETQITLDGTRAVSTVQRSLAQGLTSNMWVSLDNEVAATKSGIISSATVLQSWTVDGLLTLQSPTYTVKSAPTDARLAFEKQGDFVAVAALGLEQTKFPIRSIIRDSVADTVVITVTLPSGINTTGWQVGDVISRDLVPTHEIIRAERVTGTNQFFFDLAISHGDSNSGYQAGDTLTVVGGDGQFPSGAYSVVARVTQANGADRIECTNGAVASSIVREFSIGFATRSDSYFGAASAITSVGAYNGGTKSVALTFSYASASDLTRNFCGYLYKDLSWATTSEGDLVRIGPVFSSSSGWSLYQVPSQNQGIFRVVRVVPRDVSGRPGTIWIENADVVEGTYEARIGTYDYNSVVPGDQLVINTDQWGAENRGTWTVERVGVPDAASTAQYSSPNTLKVSLTERSPRAVGTVAALGALSSLVQIVEKNPGRAIKRICGICPNQDDPTYVDIRWDSRYQLEQISGASGTILTALDKFQFPADLAAGADGYAYNTGLIGEANKVVYGEPSDTSTYPGVAAAGAQININGPLVRRIKISVQVRVRTGASLPDVANRVRSAVASVVNQVGVGTPVALSDVVAAAKKVVGVVAVAIISPTYNAGNDLIPIQPFEKPLIVNLSQDISVTFAGE